MVSIPVGGDIKKAFAKLGANVAEVEPDNLAGAAAARWLKLSPEQRANAGLMAPSHALREHINAIVRERLIRDGQVKGPALESERLISRGYTHAEKSIAANYAPGDVVAFHRPYKWLGVEKGDELDVAGIDRDANTVNLRRKDGEIVGWIPHKLAARTGGAEVCRCESFELRAGDRIRWTKNDNRLGLINSQTLYVEISRARDRAQLVTDDRDALRERLEAVTGERISALEAVDADVGKVRDSEREILRERPGEAEVPVRGLEPTEPAQPQTERAGREIEMGM